MYILNLLLLLGVVNGAIRLYDEDAGYSCKEYRCTNGYNYIDFFTFGEPPRNTLKLGMCMMIKGNRDAYLLLSTTKDPSPDQNVYEITVGARNNTVISLAGKMSGKVLAMVNTPQVLSNEVFRTFCLKMSNNGLIQFGRGSDSYFLLYYQSHLNLDIKHFSFATKDLENSKAEVSFWYDCISIHDVCAFLNSSIPYEYDPDKNFNWQLI